MLTCKIFSKKMKNIKYIIIALITLSIVFSGCKDEEGVYLTMNVLEKTLSPKDTFQFELKTQGMNVGEGEKVVWTLQDADPKVAGTEVAQISSDGVLKAIGLGTATVRATVGGRYALAHVDVVERIPASAGDLSFEKENHYMGIVGLIPDTVILTVKATVLDLYDLKIKSDNEEIIRAELIPDTADHTGEIYIDCKVALHRGGTEGIAVVTADAGGTTVDLNVHVGVKTYLSFDRISTALGGDPSLVVTNPYTFYVNSRDTITLYYVAEPDDPAHLALLKLNVTSEGDGVLSVKEIKRNAGYYSIIVESGQLKGSQKITFTLDNNVLTADCSVMDKNDVVVNSVTVIPSFKNITTTSRGVALAEGVKVAPLAALVHWPIVWTSSDKSIATVNSLGDVTIYKAGVVKITATSKDKSDFITITSKLEIEGIAFNTGLVTTLAESETTTWTATITSNYEPIGVVKTWKSSKENVATVDANGKITAVGKGTTEISVSVFDEMGNTRVAKQNLTVTAVNIFPLDFNSKQYQYVSDIASSGSLSGISIDVFTPDFKENYQFKLYKANPGVNFNLSGTATYTVGVEIHTASTLNYLDVNESATLLPGSKLIVTNGVLTFDMTAQRGTKQVTIKGNTTEFQ